jgi:hypothetical protein
MKVRPVIRLENVIKGLKKSLPERYHNMIPMNEKAVTRGMEIIYEADCLGNFCRGHSTVLPQSAFSGKDCVYYILPNSGGQEVAYIFPSASAFLIKVPDISIRGASINLIVAAWSIFPVVLFTGFIVSGRGDKHRARMILMSSSAFFHLWRV